MIMIIEWLKGKKSYIVAGAMIIYAVAVLGWQQDNWTAAQEMILAAIALTGLRAGIKKVELAVRKK